MTKETLIKLINDILKPHGYKRKGNIWSKDGEETISIFYLQKSIYSNQYYISTRATIKDLLNRVKFNNHIDIRFEYILGHDVDHIFDFDNDMSETDREREIKKAINQLTNIQLKFESIQGIRDVINKYGNAVVTLKEAKNILENK